MTYPQHNFSKYIDTEFSFSNDISKQKMGKNIFNEDRFADLSCNDNILLEPRIQEYIRKKKYYKQNGIEPSINIEQEYNISNYDKKQIRNFLKGGRNLYTNQNLEINNIKNNKIDYFPSSTMEVDKKLEKFMPQNLKKTYNTPENFGMFKPTDGNSFYDQAYVPNESILDQRDFRHTEYNYSKFDPRVDPLIPPGIEDIDPNKSYMNVRVNGQEAGSRMYNTTASALSQNRLIREKDLSGALNKWNSRSAGPIHFDKLDFNNPKDKKPKVVYGRTDKSIPNEELYEIGDPYDRDTGHVKKSKKENTRTAILHKDEKLYPLDGTTNKDSYNLEVLTVNNEYASPYAKPFEPNCSLLGDLETDEMKGIVGRAGKSYGYRRSDEHSYSYIDPELQNHNVTLMPFHGIGVPTRFENRNRKKPYNRELY